MSCGAIVLYCLNLPPHLRYKTENTFIVGLMPSPNLPTAITICHLLDPFIESVAKYGVAPGQEVSTYTNPAGALVQVKVAPLVSDLEATRKASGFLDHSATMFCSVCLCRHDEIENLIFTYGNTAMVQKYANKQRNGLAKRLHQPEKFYKKHLEYAGLRFFIYLIGTQ